MTTPTLAARGGEGGGLRSSLTSAAEALLPALEPVATPKGLFATLPYLQLGDAPAQTGAAEHVALHWETTGSALGNWSVETRPAGRGEWRKTAAAAEARPLAIPGEEARRLWSARLDGLRPGALFDYRVSSDGKPVFAGRARARRAAPDPFRFAVFGDAGAGTKEQRRIAYQASLASPDMVFITGDIVYAHGRYSEYQEKFFPVYNADTASEGAGAPLLRSTLMMAAPGNHDVAYDSAATWPDGLAYFYLWDLPRNGPAEPGGRYAPRIAGNPAAEKAVEAASNGAYPRTTNYSFDYGNTHWTVLDSNDYVDWTDHALRDWVERDLSSAKTATWRFVAFHHPPFQSSKQHEDNQWMRVLCDLFEKYRVDVVWSGHVHNYQRTYPLRFAAKPGPDGKLVQKDGRVAGDWTLDKTFDGEKTTRATAPIYVVTGGGGAALYDADKDDKPEAWQPFTARYAAAVNSLTVVDIDGGRMSVRQLSDTGKELDKFTLTK
jgi:predicted phosphohydrolase